MNVVAFDPYVSAERYRELGVEKAETSDDVYAKADIITLHLPKTPDTAGWLNDEAFAKMRDGVRIINVARGELVDHEALQRALESGKVGGAALDVFPTEPITEHPLFGMDGVIVTPHLGASTAEAQDRAGVITAEQVVAALEGGIVTNAVNIPRLSAEDMEQLGPLMPLCTKLGRLAMALGEASSVDRIQLRYEGRLADFDTRLLTIAVLNGVLVGHTEEPVNLVNAHTLAEERGIVVAEQREPESVRLRGGRARGGGLRLRLDRGRGHGLRAAPGAAPRVRVRPELQHGDGGPLRVLPLPRPAGHDRAAWGRPSAATA